MLETIESNQTDRFGNDLISPNVGFDSLKKFKIPKDSVEV